MSQDSKKGMNGWGGSRKGAGRKSTCTGKRKISVSLNISLLEKMGSLPGSRSVIIEEALRMYLAESRHRMEEDCAKSSTFQKDAMIDLIIKIEPRARLSAPVSIAELWRRSEASGWNRRDFEEILFELAEEYRIFLHSHAHEMQASEALKKAALRGRNGSLYIGLVLGKMKSESIDLSS
jgi:hypothetical protein